MAAGIMLPVTGLGTKIGLVALPLNYFLWLAVTLLCYCILTQVIKQWYIRRFERWL
jgi:Mg2+-importing ATPase